MHLKLKLKAGKITGMEKLINILYTRKGITDLRQKYLSIMQFCDYSRGREAEVEST